MRIVMAGASGFLGTHLRRRLVTDGHELVTLVRREPGAGQVRWAPERGELDPATLAGADAVINLAGAGVGDRRWNAAYKQLLRDSRVGSTYTIARALSATPAEHRPAVLLNASAVGFYGDTGDTTVDEDSPAGTGFFPDLCRAWEAATQPAEDAGVRVVRLRTGYPLAADGGLLKPLLLPFRLFVGGRLGSGRQWMPWLALADWLGAVVFLLGDGGVAGGTAGSAGAGGAGTSGAAPGRGGVSGASVAGPVNLVGPAPARNADFTRALGKALHRPALAPVPAFALRALLGEFGAEAVASQRVLPAVLTRAGFSFTYPDLDSALHAALHRPPA